MFVLPDMLFKMTRFFIGSMAIKTFIRSVCIIHKIIVKIILEELAIPWNWLDKTCTKNTRKHTQKEQIIVKDIYSYLKRQYLKKNNGWIFSMLVYGRNSTFSSPI